ncbi:hypothetical protein PR003_g10874 [Phytophthora rubi]|uniref:Uncharacterized protein n=1 Tax=Phytophthora rubi TaxID=129364 RepID=A0A6A3MYC8_9STRA|nr:hypothetical protein PR002_g8925 [Phytophthora rubi]KAE9037060.1 hypothetical protein PR001_g8540 [Phytophthora rubi]KAE9339716.1 hypothetical protein PR003_g10874 [Phytophthora rubi]
MAAGGSLLVLAKLVSKCRALGGACCGSTTTTESNFRRQSGWVLCWRRSQQLLEV